MAAPTEAELLLSAMQPLPEDATGQQRVLRVLSRLVAPQMLEAGIAHDLVVDGDLEYTTDFVGPWTLRVVALKFEIDTGSGLIPNVNPKDFGLYVKMAGVLFPLAERIHSASHGFVITDPIPLGPTDQLVVKASNATGLAKLQIRGEKR